MQAMVYHNYGSPDVLESEDVEKPVAGDSQILIKVYAASLNAADWHRMRADIFLVRFMGGGFFNPKNHRLGIDLAGRVEATGSHMTRLRPGDEVFGTGMGTFAEYACAREDAVTLKPANLTFEAAAAVPVAAVTALQGLRDSGKIQPGQSVLIHGASGGVGTFAVQLAKWFGADVTAVCSTRNLDRVRSLGANHVIDYTREDFTQTGQRFDLILAINGYHPLLTYRRVLNPAGICVLVGTSRRLFYSLLQAMLLGTLISSTGKQKIGFMGRAKIYQQDLVFLKELLETGEIVPVIDRRYRFREAAEAFRYFGEGHARGKIVLIMPANDKA